MKKVKYIVAGFLGMLALQSCSEDTMDDINKMIITQDMLRVDLF